MGHFQGGDNRGGGFRGGDRGGRPPFQKKNWGNDRGGDREVTMHKATCSDCQKTCEVPFRPSGDKPVYCNDCFGSKREGGDRGPRQDFGNRGPKRDFSDRSAPRSDFKSAPANDDVKKQLVDLSNKIDRLVSAVERLTYAKSEAPVAKTVSVVTKKVEVKKVPNLKTVVKKATKKVPAKKK